MPTYNLAQLRTLQMQATITARLKALLITNGLPGVSEWAPSANGGVELSVVEMAAGALASIVAPKLVAITEGRFLAIGTGAWLTAYAKSRYKITRGAATYTIQNIRLLSAEGDSFPALGLWVAGAGGNRYVSIEPVQLVAGVSQDIQFQAENPGSAYFDGPGTVTRMITAPAGLTATNVRHTDFADTKVSGSSTGTIKAAFSAPGVRPTFDSIRVRIDVYGDIGGGICSISTDGGVNFPESMPIPASRVVGTPATFQATLTFTNGTTPSFVQGDVFTLLVGDAILQRGNDEESDPALRDRCRSRWSTLSDVPTEGLVRLWCHEASPEVARVRVGANANAPGGMLVTLASATGPASPQAQLAVLDYISTRLRGYRGVPAPDLPGVGGSPVETVQCRTAKPREITQYGLVTVPRARVAAIQMEADRRWLAYLGGIDIGGIVRMPELIQAIMDAGALDVTGVLLGLPMAPHANVALASDEVAVPAAGVTLTNSMAWKPV